MNKTIETKATVDHVIAHLKGTGWRLATVGRYEKEGSHLAVEVGYVYGEVTVKITENSQGRNAFRLQTIRGNGSGFREDAPKEIDRWVRIEKADQDDPLNETHEGHILDGAQKVWG